MKKGWVFCGGMIRSGSTLQYQIASELFERLNVGQRATYYPPFEHPLILAEQPGIGLTTFKTHVLTDDVKKLCLSGDAVSLYIYRDIRDVLSSYQEKYSISLVGDCLKKWVTDLLAIDSSWKSLPSIYISRYEDVIQNIELEIVKIAVYLNVECPVSVAKEIAESLSYSSQQKMLTGVSLWIDDNKVNVYDGASLLHKNHFQSGKVGRYKEDLTASQIFEVEEVSGDWLCRMGYETTR